MNFKHFVVWKCDFFKVLHLQKGEAANRAHCSCSRRPATAGGPSDTDCLVVLTVLKNMKVS